MYRFLRPVICAALLLLSAPVWAEENAKPNPAGDAFTKLSEGLSDSEKRHLGSVYNSHNAINVVKSVQQTLKMAVEGCGEKHPDMKETINKRYKEWSDDVSAVVSDAEANITNMITVQDYASKDAINNLLGVLDKTRAEHESAIKKIPVTSEEACEYMLKNMDKTQPSLIKYMRATLISLPLDMQEDMQEEAEEKAKDEAEKAAKEAEKAAEKAAKEAEKSESE